MFNLILNFIVRLKKKSKRRNLFRDEILINPIILFCLICSVTFPLFAGAIRHDVPDEKYTALGNMEQFAPVGLILKDDQPYASCVLISAEWILTAGHAAGDIAAGRFTVQFGNEKYNVKELIVNSKFQPGILGMGTDLSLFRLDKPVKSIKPAMLYTGSGEKGLIGTAVGFGRSGTAKTVIGNATPIGTKRAGQNVIDSIGGIIGGRKYPDNLLIADFDYPNDSSLNKLGDSKPLDLEYCPIGGDSGGGLFIEENGKWMLAGIASGVSVKINEIPDCGIYGSLVYWTRVSTYQEWIGDVLKRDKNLNKPNNQTSLRFHRFKAHLNKRFEKDRQDQGARNFHLTSKLSL